MYLLSNGRNYIGLDYDNRPTSVCNINKALSFTERQKAVNYKENLKTTLKKFNWEVIEIKEEQSVSCELSEINFTRTMLDEKDFDIVEFFKNTITTVSQLKEYAANMDFEEKQYNKKIKDARHYKRDKKTKLNAIQLQRLEQFEIKLERERYECKSNRLIAELFFKDLSRLGNPDYINIVKDIKESEYKPEILTYEMLDEIVGKKRKDENKGE